MNRCKTLPARAIKGRRIVNEWGIVLGTIEDLVIDLQSGRVEYAVLAFNSAAGRPKLFAMPWDSLSYHAESGEFILDVPRDMLEEAPGFDRENWPEAADASWGVQVFTYVR